MALVKTTEINTAPHSDLQPFLATSSTEDVVICKSPDKLQKLLQAIREGGSVHYVSDGDWSMHDLVGELLKKHKPAELWITTYALRELPVRTLVLAQERKEIISVKMLLDYRAKVRTPEVFQLALMSLNQIFLTSVHAKVCVIRSGAGTLTIVGSANWTSNPRIECGVISTDPVVAGFHINWIEKIMDHAEIFS